MYSNISVRNQWWDYSAASLFLANCLEKLISKTACRNVSGDKIAGDGTCFVNCWIFTLEILFTTTDYHKYNILYDTNLVLLWRELFINFKYVLK